MHSCAAYPTHASPRPNNMREYYPVSSALQDTGNRAFLYLPESPPRQGLLALVFHTLLVHLFDESRSHTSDSGRKSFFLENGRRQRKPILLFELSGLFLFRLAERAFLSLLFQEPPRSNFSSVPNDFYFTTLSRYGFDPTA